MFAQPAGEIVDAAAGASSITTKEVLVTKAAACSTGNAFEENAAPRLTRPAASGVRAPGTWLAGSPAESGEAVVRPTGLHALQSGIEASSS